MAKATLPTNFKDDILASSMGSKRRYNVINNSDGTISLEDVTDYTQVGSTFGAAQINATNAAANAAADASKIIDDYDTLMANTQAGYMAGALAVKELNSNLNCIKNGEINIVNGCSFSLNIGKDKHYIILHKKGAPATSPLNYLFFLDNDYLIRTWVDGSTTIYNGVTVTYSNGVATFSSTLVSTYFGTQSDMCWTA